MFFLFNKPSSSSSTVTISLLVQGPTTHIVLVGESLIPRHCVEMVSTNPVKWFPLTGAIQQGMTT